MRYFISLALPESVLSFGISHPTFAAVTVFLRGSSLGLLAGDLGTMACAVAISTITRRADPHLAVTVGTMVKAGSLHRHTRPIRAEIKLD